MLVGFGSLLINKGRLRITMGAFKKYARRGGGSGVLKKRTKTNSRRESSPSVRLLCEKNRLTFKTVNRVLFDKLLRNY